MDADQWKKERRDPRFRPDPLTVEEQAQKRLKDAQKRAAREKLKENLKKFRYRLQHVERRRGDTEWLCRVSGIGPEGENVRNLYLTLRTPSPLSFDLTYDWEMLSICPLWVEYYHAAGETVRLNMNVRRSPIK